MISHVSSAAARAGTRPSGPLGHAFTPPPPPLLLLMLQCIGSLMIKN